MTVASFMLVKKITAIWKMGGYLFLLLSFFLSFPEPTAPPRDYMGVITERTA